MSIGGIGNVFAELRVGEREDGVERVWSGTMGDNGNVVCVCLARTSATDIVGKGEGDLRSDSDELGETS